MYIGEFVDGMFHGDGTIYFPNLGKFKATWVMGQAQDGEYSFKDGLVYEEPHAMSPAPEYAPPPRTRRVPLPAHSRPTPRARPVPHSGNKSPTSWQYCCPNDRRFYTEHLNGLKPAGESQLANHDPPREVRTAARGRMHARGRRASGAASANHLVHPPDCMPASHTQPPAQIPDGMYDAGDGVYDHERGQVLSYEGEFLRTPDSTEIGWLIKHARRGGGVLVRTAAAPAAAARSQAPAQTA